MKSSAVVLREWHGLPPPAELFAGLCEREGSFFLDSGLESGGLGRFSFIGFDPFLKFRARRGEITLTSAHGNKVFQGDALTELKRLMATFRPARDPAVEIPFLGGAVGGFSYEYGAGLENVTSRAGDDLQMPEAQFGFYDGILAFDRENGRAFAVANPVAAAAADEILDRLERAVNEVARVGSSPPGLAAPEISERAELNRRIKDHPPGLEPQSNFSKDEYLRAIDRIKFYIREGDVYQVNLAQRFEVPLVGSPYALYQRLRTHSPAPFASYFNLGEFQVVSSSPERFLRIRGRNVDTRPIKGTRPRGQTPEEDARLRRELLASEKDRAELLMIVDLERNDLGRVCEFGSVRVDEMARLETHPTVFHLVSAVSGQLRADCDAFDCIRAAFPGGSITGAPKIRAMQVIEEIETRPRNWYTGAMGYIDFDGSCDLNIAIRTILCRADRAYYHVGGGIVWDSDPESEYQETLDKGRAMRAALMAK